MFSKSQDLREIKQKADEAFLKQKWKKALELYDQYASANAFDARVVQRMAELERKLGNGDASFKRYKQLADYFVAQGFWAKAMAISSILTELDPSDTSFQNKIAKHLSNERKSIVKHTDEIIELKPEEESFEIQNNSLGEKTLPHQNIPLFSDLSAQEILSVMSRLNHKNFKENEYILKEGDVGQSMFIIGEGLVEINTHGAHNEKIILNRLKGGDFFGEYGLITQKPRSANVQARTDVEVLEITRTDFDVIANQYPSIWLVLEKHLKERLIKTICQKSSVFKHLNESDQVFLSELVEEKKYQAGEAIFKEGDEGQAMYFIKSGKLSVSIQEGASRVEIAHLNAGDFFGEMALISGQKRSATVRAQSEAELFVLEKENAKRLFKQNSQLTANFISAIKERNKDKAQTLEAYKEATLSLV